MRTAIEGELQGTNPRITATNIAGGGDFYNEIELFTFVRANALRTLCKRADNNGFQGVDPHHTLDNTLNDIKQKLSLV